MQDFEKLGAFYLGKEFDLASGKRQDDLLLYDSKDLTTHAVCVGMTGSGKTGLCVSLLEEAAIDGIPVIAIDPKGDLGNLCLTFPKLDAASFRPWIDESAATRKGKTPDQFAADISKLWTKGLGEWGQNAARIKRLRDSVDISIYTPGSSAGLGLTVLKSFAAPPAEIVEDTDAFREQVSASTAGLLTLLGVDADPVQSREFILVSNLLDHFWRDGRDVEIADLIQAIQEPPFEKVGIIDLDTFLPKKARTALAMRLNNLLASPTFARWMEGEPLIIKDLLYTKEGKPRISIVSITHLSDEERMFFVTILLNEILAWTRSQSGTSSLRALLYMDEVFGYFPPTANPPSKTPMLTLLKQARAFGLGIMLATQNPVDLDYKGLSNTGTWFLGRLQTERDKARVLEGLEGASAQAGVEFDRQKMEATLAGLGKRVFLMNNVHEDHPVVFQTRWAMSYLSGPMTRKQIQKLMAPRRAKLKKEAKAKQPPAAKIAPAEIEQVAAPPVTPQTKTKSSGRTTTTKGPKSNREKIPASVPQYYASRTALVGANSKLIYRPALLGPIKLHFTRSTYSVDFWQDRRYFLQLDPAAATGSWDDCQLLEHKLRLDSAPDPKAQFVEIPDDLTSSKNYTRWRNALKEFAYHDRFLTVWKCAQFKQHSQAGETEGEFRARLKHFVQEKRDLQIEKLRTRYSGRLGKLRDRIRAAEQKLVKEKSQYRRSSVDSAVSFGSSLLGALFGRKIATRTNVNRTASSVKGMNRALDQRVDVKSASLKLEDLKQDYAEMEKKFAADAAEVESGLRVEDLALEPIEIRPRKTDIQIDKVALVWTPWAVSKNGTATAAFDLSGQQGLFL